MSLLDDLAAKLVADNVGVIGTSIFMSSAAVIPIGDGPFISLNEVGGVAPTRIQNARAVATQRPTVQVLVRAGGAGTAYPTARDKAWAAYQSLDGTFNTTLSGTFYLKIAAKQEPTDMGFDATGVRVQVVFNLEIEKYPSAGSLVVPYMVIDILGGNAFSFISPAVSDVYPSGAGYAALIPGSWPIVIDKSQLLSGNYVLEADAKTDITGGRVKAGLFDLANPNTPLVELIFSEQTTGERQRSSPIPFVGPGTVTLGVKATVNNVFVSSAVWGARLLRVS